jgi:hypothetical protein
MPFCVICPWQRVLQHAHGVGTSMHHACGCRVQCLHVSRKPPLEKGSWSYNAARGALLRESPAVTNKQTDIHQGWLVAGSGSPSFPFYFSFSFSLPRLATI